MCQNIQTGNLERDHDGSCKCGADTHYCIEKCRVPICRNICKMPYNVKDHKHICIQTACPYKCQVKCWDKTLNMEIECGRDCNCNEHAHHLDDDEKTKKHERHICANEHRMFV